LSHLFFFKGADMPTVQDVLRDKGGRVQTIPASRSVMEAINQMNQHKIGALVVVDEERIVGMFTERDVLRRVVPDARRPEEILVGEVMTRDVVCCASTADLDEVSTIMKERRIRHLPVCDDHEQLIGLISIGDVNAQHASHQQATIHYLSDYIYGRA
jgi:CBS domain-containing protein